MAWQNGLQQKEKDESGKWHSNMCQLINTLHTIFKNLFYVLLGRIDVSWLIDTQLNYLDMCNLEF